MVVYVTSVNSMKNKKEVWQKRYFDYNRTVEAQRLIAKLQALEPAVAAVYLRNAKQMGLLNHLVDEWPDDLQKIIDRV